MIRKLFLTAVICATAIFSKAQTNGGFENWGSQFGEPQQPTGWVTANIFKLISPSNDTSCFKATSPNNIVGTASMKLETIVLAVNPDTATIPDTIGVAYNGSVILFPFSIVDRIPYPNRPSNLHFQAKYTPVGVDSGYCFIELTKWNNALMRRDTIGTGWALILASANPLTYMTPILYYPNHMNTLPDSMALAFSSSSPYVPMPGSVLYADDIYFTGWNSVEDVNNSNIHFTAFPNPAKDVMTITADLDNASKVRIYDGLGRVIGTFLMQDKKYILNTSALQAGSYYFSVMDKNEDPLGGNNFNVVK